jgi:ABC-type Na+ efflux pump permease subunit
MPSATTQTIPPAEHFSQSRLTATIIALVVVACVLALFIFTFQSRQKIQPPAATINPQALMRQAIISQLSKATPATPTEIEQINAQLNAVNTTVTDEQRAAIINQLKAQ